MKKQTDTQQEKLGILDRIDSDLDLKAVWDKLYASKTQLYVLFGSCRKAVFGL